MPRLTKWNGKKWVLPQGMWREIADRLAAYENTGMEPEEIAALQAHSAAEQTAPAGGGIISAVFIRRNGGGYVPHIDPRHRTPAYLRSGGAGRQSRSAAGDRRKPSCYRIQPGLLARRPSQRVHPGYGPLHQTLLIGGFYHVLHYQRGRGQARQGCQQFL